MLKNKHIQWLAFVSALPFILLILFTSFQVSTGLIILLFCFTLSPVHVSATIYLFTFKSIRERKKLLLCTALYILISMPLLIMVILYCSKEILLLLTCLYFAWAHWHYGMQNVGICALSSTVENEIRSSNFHKNLFMVIAICGALGSLKSSAAYHFGYGEYLDLARMTSVFNFFFIIGACIYAACILVALAKYNYFNLAHTRLLYLCLTFFYLPLFLFPTSPLLSFAVYGSVHGLQYLSILSFNPLAEKNYKYRLFMLISFVLICFVAGKIYMNIGVTTNYLAYGLRDTSIIPVIGVALMYLVTSAHFLFDSQIWSGRLPKNRKFLQEMFAS